jgi:hypothetical protein
MVKNFFLIFAAEAACWNKIDEFNAVPEIKGDFSNLL